MDYFGIVGTEKILERQGWQAYNTLNTKVISYEYVCIVYDINQNIMLKCSFSCSGLRVQGREDLCLHRPRRQGLQENSLNVLAYRLSQNPCPSRCETILCTNRIPMVDLCDWLNYHTVLISFFQTMFLYFLAVKFIYFCLFLSDLSQRFCTYVHIFYNAYT